jgi:hypothetical protein
MNKKIETITEIHQNCRLFKKHGGQNPGSLWEMSTEDVQRGEGSGGKGAGKVQKKWRGTVKGRESCTHY